MASSQSRDQVPVRDDADDSETWRFQQTKKHKLTKKDGTPRKPRRGWGPYRSVPNERAVAFHLQLDVQNLQQEVRNLTSLRDILQTKKMIQRHSPEGSLCRIVNEYFQVFRQGVEVQEYGRKRIVDGRYRDQRAFMDSIMDEQVDLGHGMYGPDVMMEQMARYSLFLRFICMAGKVDDIVVADDAVMITYKGTLQFQVLRSTIEMIFPHIMGNEWFVSQLVGQLVEAQGHSTFHFNAAGKCFKYDVDMDFVAAFTNVVKDIHFVDVLLGQALISDNAFIGAIDEGNASSTWGSDIVLTRDDCDLEEEQKAPAIFPVAESATSDTYFWRSERAEFPSTSLTRLEPCTVSRSDRRFCQQVVESIVQDYFFAFAQGYQEDAELISEFSQREFLLHRFASQMQVGVETTVNCVKERWRVLSECFEVLSFQHKGATQTECDKNCNLCLVESSAGYILRFTFYTIQSVFPHLVSNIYLLDILVGKVIVVPSRIYFSVEKNTGRISRVKETMDFVAAIGELIPDRQDLSYVVSQALLTRDGVDCSKFESALPEQQNEASSLRQIDSEHHRGCQTASRTMNMSDILN